MDEEGAGKEMRGTCGTQGNAREAKERNEGNYCSWQRKRKYKEVAV